MTAAAEVYRLEPHRMNPVKRYAMMAVFWFMALISMGSATPVPSTNAWAVVRKADGSIVGVVDDEMAGEHGVQPQLEADLASMTAAEFADAWGLDDDTVSNG